MRRFWNPSGWGLAMALAVAFTACPSSSPPGLGSLDLPQEAPDGVVPDAEVPDGAVGEEVGPRPCLRPEDCPEGLVCDPETHACVECVTVEDCPEGLVCRDRRCEPECTTSMDCPQGWECQDGSCVEPPKPCGEGGDCPEGLHCEPTTNVCVACLDDSHCPTEAYCDPVAHRCLPDLCFAGVLDCVGNAVVRCRDNGSGWDLVETCAAGWTCRHGACVQECTPSCVRPDGSRIECGPDGCGGECGTCRADESCIEGECQVLCIPACDGKACGDNGCGGVCGECEPGWTCLDGQCVGGESCGEGLDCLWTCTDDATLDACIEGCAAPLLPDEREAFEVLVACLREHCDPAPPAGSCWKQVIENQCKGLRDACVACVPLCAGKECGPDGCGGSCGTCPSGTVCEDYHCKATCIPQCANKECGDDGCGGQCGVCPAGAVCQGGKCTCVPQCAGKQCGPDGCGGQCGTCPQGTSCQNGKCVCVPQCAGKQCGPDGCGGSCGTCPQGTSCQNGKCVCVPQCAGKQCGPDGCGGQCGTCPLGQTCNPSGQCVPCTPKCQGKQCGPDGCGGTCGTCPQGTTCQNGLCVCTPQCAGKECGPDGCGGTCGTCQVGFYCSMGRCQQECMPNCIGKPCGPDGCGGSCGTCPDGYYCSTTQQCLPSCLPNCAGKECGPDGCGGQCGGCGPDEFCSKEGRCEDFWSCYDILVCNWGCAPNDQACSNQCFQNGSPAAQKQWMDLWKCLFDQCGNAPPHSPCWGQAMAGACKSLYYQCLDCTPNCIGKQCGPDGCGGSCGTCPGGAACDEYGQCPCVPKCSGRECGPDGCGGLCGTCAEPLVCNASGRCVCQPQCSGKECGPDGCGGSCGKCPDNWTCVLGKCQSPCQPQCEGKECGPDGCGGSCGTCPEGQECIEDLGVCGWASTGCEPSYLPGCGGCPCEACVCGLDPYCCEIAWDEVCVDECWQCGGCGCLPNCTNPDGTVKQCGPDGCGGSCGTCPPGYTCNPAGDCVPGGVLLTCEQGISCLFACSATFDICLPSCGEQVTPSQRDAFYGLMKCAYQYCATPWGGITPECFYMVAKAQCESYYLQCIGGCVPNCSGKQCGPDGCGGSCGTCPPGYTCTSSGQCQPPQQKGCADAVQCVLSCGGLDWPCIEGCISGLSPQSQQLLIQLATCVVQTCGLNPSQQCIMKAIQGPCQKQFLACMADGGGVIILPDGP